MTEPITTAAHKSKRRIAFLTAVAGLALWLLASVYGTFCAWALANVVSEDTSAWLLVTVGAAVGLLVAFAIVWTAVTHAAGSVHTAFYDLIVDVEDLRWRRAVELGEGLGLAMGVPAPRIWLVTRSTLPNALAVGIRPDRTDVYLTAGLTDLLTRDEQERSRQRHGIDRRFDVALGTVGYAIGGGRRPRGNLSQLGPPSLDPVAPTRALGLIGWMTKRLTLEWGGEGSDAAAMGYTRHPRALYSALVKLDRDQRDVGVIPISTRQLWFEYPLDEASATTDRTAQRPVALTRRIAHVADELRAIDPSWEPPPPCSAGTSSAAPALRAGLSSGRRAPVVLEPGLDAAGSKRMRWPHLM